MAARYRPRLMRRRPTGMTTLRSRAIDGGMSYEVELDTRPEKVPGTLLVHEAACPPVALMLHGAGSDRARMSESIGLSLLGHGVASLSVDLPMHGGREGDVRDLSIQSPLEVVRAWKLAVAEAREAIWILNDDSRFNSRAIGIVGYSLGAYLATIVASGEQSIRAVLLAAGGNFPPSIP